jgi:hypothetical protein
MSENVDLTLILRSTQAAARAAQAALDIAEGLKSDMGNRLTALEARFTALEGRFASLEGRVTTLAAEQDSLHRAVLRVADLLDGVDGRLVDIATRLTPKS